MDEKDNKQPELSAAQQQEKLKHDAETKQMRENLRAAEATYKKLTAQMEAILDDVRKEKKLRVADMEGVQQQVIQLHESVNGSILFDILQLVRFDTKYYGFHAVNVALLNLTIGKIMGVAEGTLHHLAKVGLLSDIGMLLLPIKVLEDAQDLNNFDKAMIRKHPEFAKIVLEKSGLGSDTQLVEAVLAHQERYDGSGYPSGLAGDDIPFEARVTAVSDSFDAASARRKYRTGKSPFAILQELADNKTRGLDPHIAHAAALGIAQMLVGHFVVLSDRSVGKVVEVYPMDIAYPDVVVLGRRVHTGPELYPVSLSGHMDMF